MRKRGSSGNSRSAERGQFQQRSGVITDLGVMEVTPAGLKVTELAPGVTQEQIAAATGTELDFSAL